MYLFQNSWKAFFFFCCSTKILFKLYIHMLKKWYLPPSWYLPGKVNNVWNWNVVSFHRRSPCGDRKLHSSSSGGTVPEAGVCVQRKPIVSKLSSVVFDHSLFCNTQTPLLDRRPDPVMWIKDGGELPDLDRIIVEGRELIFTSLNKTDNGTYRCEASNHLGTNSAEYVLYVYGEFRVSLVSGDLWLQDSKVTVLYTGNRKDQKKCIYVWK